MESSEMPNMDGGPAGDRLRKMWFAVASTALEDGIDDAERLQDGARLALGLPLASDSRSERADAGKRAGRRVTKMAQDSYLRSLESELAAAIARLRLSVGERAVPHHDGGGKSPRSWKGARDHLVTDEADFGRRSLEIESDSLRQLAELAVDGIWRDLPAGARPTSRPKCVILGGQPGAGKSSSILEFTAAEPELVVVALDDYRKFHPFFMSLFGSSVTDPAAYPDGTGSFASLVRDLVLQRCLAEGRSVLLEHTLGSRDRGTETRALALIDPFVRYGFRFHLRFVATPEIISLASTVLRYTKLINATMTIRSESSELMVDGGRWVGLEAHRSAYTTGPHNAREVASLIGNSLDTVEVVGRSGSTPIIYERVHPGYLSGAWLESAIETAHRRLDPRLACGSEYLPRNAAVRYCQEALDGAHRRNINLDSLHHEFVQVLEYFMSGRQTLPAIS